MPRKIDIDRFGGASPFVWTHEHLTKVLCYESNSVVKEPRIKEAFRTVKREDFVKSEDRFYAYADMALEIGFGQTISQPTVVAQMLQLLNPKLGGKYLDIGAGSGFVSALIGKIVGSEGKVIGLERIQLLAEQARESISRYPEFSNVTIYLKDGSKGFPEGAPYDGIHVGAAYDLIPEELIDQLKIGGKLVVPTKENDIRVIIRETKEDTSEKIYPGYVFVPIVEGVE
ncbi:protein-L-isoaspartate O-methyltransferase [Candidatus Dojkabacteria bacterium]|nr:protein-L-isoaspartate O-methyltransferase [Candidatus Dojkabacteria bacterium]